MIPEARSSKLVRGPIRDAVGALEYLDCGGTGRGKTWLSQVVDCCVDNKSVIWDRVVWYGVHVGYHIPYNQGQWGVTHHRPCGGAMEGHHYQHWSMPVRIQRIEWSFAWVQSMDMKLDGQLRDQTTLKYWGHAEGVHIWYICVYPQGLWYSVLGGLPVNTGRVWGGPPGLPTPDPILVSGNHGGEG